MKKNIVIINQDSGYLMVDLANAYSKAGHSVSLVTGRLVERNIPIDHYVQIYKIKKYNKSSFYTRLFSWLVASIQIAYRVIFNFKKSHLIFVSNPPIAVFVNVFIRRDFTFLVYDVYPDALAEIGYANCKSILYKIWGALNRIVYEKAVRIITISESMATTISQYTTRKVEIIPIWTDNAYLKPMAVSENIFIKKHNLEGKFIIMYSGNLGETANAEVMVDLAQLLIARKDIVFVIAGEGSQKKKIAQRIESESLSNCLLLPWQDAEMLPHSLSAANLAVVSLHNSAGKIALPSKLYSLLSVGVPILGICDEDTELAKIIDGQEIGKCFRFGMNYEIIEFIQLLSSNKSIQNQLHLNVLRLSKKYDSTNVSRFII